MIQMAVWLTVAVVLVFGTMVTETPFKLWPTRIEQVKEWLHGKLIWSGLIWVFGGAVYAVWWAVIHES